MSKIDKPDRRLTLVAYLDTDVESGRIKSEHGNDCNRMYSCGFNRYRLLISCPEK